MSRLRLAMRPVKRQNREGVLEDALRLYVKLDNDRRAGCRITPADWAKCHQAAQAALKPTA